MLRFPMAVRVLHINSETGWRGGERFLADLLAHLPASVESMALCRAGGEAADRLTRAGRAVTTLPMRGSWDLGSVLGLRRLVRSWGPAVVHAHTSRAHALAALACRGLPARLLVTRHVAFPIGRNPLSRWVYRQPHAYVAVSTQVASRLHEAGVPRDRVRVIHNGLDPVPFAVPRDPAIRADLGIPADLPLAVVVGALTAEKGHHLLFDAWKRLPEPHPRLLVVGDGPLLQELQAAAPAGTVFAGRRDDIPRLLAAADLLVSSSWAEGLPYAVIEAMAAGLPVVATAAGGTVEVVEDGVSGLVVPVGDAAALAAAVARVLSTPGLASAFGTAGRRLAGERFSLPGMAAAYADLYRACA